jgi:hypothetical protein
MPPEYFIYNANISEIISNFKDCIFSPHKHSMHDNRDSKIR